MRCGWKSRLSLGNPSRALRTPWTEKILEMESQGATLEELIPFITGKAAATGWQTGKVDEGILPAGQVVGLIHDVPTVADLVKRIVQEATDAKTLGPQNGRRTVEAATTDRCRPRRRQWRCRLTGCR